MRAYDICVHRVGIFHHQLMLQKEKCPANNENIGNVNAQEVL
jgi:hypothetical protein